MLMLCAILFPILAGLGLAAWRPHGRIARQNYVLAFGLFLLLAFRF